MREEKRKIEKGTKSGESSENLALSAKDGDNDAFEELAKRYEKPIRAIAASFNVPESEREDLYQEGLIALYRAVGRYDESIAKLSTFATVCIKRAMLNWIRDHVSKLDADGTTIVQVPLDEELEGILSDGANYPEESYISKEAVVSMKRNALMKLSSYEKCVFLLYLEDMSLQEISDSLGKSRKSTENTLGRIRRKLTGKK